MPLDKGYWFPAKRYGWGWTWPCAWQGWASLGVFVVFLAAGLLIFPPRLDLQSYLIYNVAIALAFFGLCWWKGEPPRWRWGDRIK